MLYLVLQGSDVNSAPYPREIMKWTEEAVYTPMFETLTNISRGSDTTQVKKRLFVWTL